jgi:hypothetical protein
MAGVRTFAAIATAMIASAAQAQTWTVPAESVRIRWTEVAVSVPGPVALRDAVTGVEYATLAYGESSQGEYPPETMTVYADLDGSGGCDPGEAFEPFQRDAGDFFHVLLVTNDVGVLALVGLSEGGPLSTRPGAACP